VRIPSIRARISLDILIACPFYFVTCYIKSTKLVGPFLVVTLFFFFFFFFFFFYFLLNTVFNFPNPKFSIASKIKQKSFHETCAQTTQHIMDHNNNAVPRIHVFSSQTPPSPPMFSFLIALSIATLIFMCFYIFPVIVSAVILLALCITVLFLCRFTPDPELRETVSFHAPNPQNNQRVVQIFNNFFWVLEEKRGGQRQQVKKLLGSIVCFGNQATVSGGSPYYQNSINHKLVSKIVFFYHHF